MTVRRATEADLPLLRELWERFRKESPAPGYVEPSSFDAEISTATGFLAEDGGRPVGFALAGSAGAAIELHDLWVEPGARSGGVGKELVRAVAEAWPEASHFRLEANLASLRFYERLGFREESRRFVAEVEALTGHAAREPRGPSFGSVHVQTDDVAAVERAVRQFVPRLPGGSRGSFVSAPRGGWVAVYDDAADRDPAALRRLARELGERMGAVVLAIGVEEGAVTRFVLFERGTIVDEYLSVQEYHGPLPPGDVIALAANPRVVARLTGADPAAVRAASVHGDSPDDLPPARDVLVAIAAAMGIEGAGHGWSDAPELPGAVRLDR